MKQWSLQALEGKWHPFEGASAREGRGGLALATVLPIHSHLSMRHVPLIQKILLIIASLCLTTHCWKYTLLCIAQYGRTSIAQPCINFVLRWTLRWQPCSFGCMPLLGIWSFCPGGLQVKYRHQKKAAFSSAGFFQQHSWMPPSKCKGFIYLAHASLILLLCHYSTAVINVTGLVKDMKCILVSILICCISCESCGGHF